MKAFREVHEVISKRHRIECNEPLSIRASRIKQCPCCLAVEVDGLFQDVVSATTTQFMEFRFEGKAIGWTEPRFDGETPEQAKTRYFARDTRLRDRLDEVTYEMVS